MLLCTYTDTGEIFVLNTFGPMLFFALDFFAPDHHALHESFPCVGVYGVQNRQILAHSFPSRVKIFGAPPCRKELPLELRPPAASAKL